MNCEIRTVQKNMRYLPVKVFSEKWTMQYNTNADFKNVSTQKTLGQVGENSEEKDF